MAWDIQVVHRAAVFCYIVHSNLLKKKNEVLKLIPSRLTHRSHLIGHTLPRHDQTSPDIACPFLHRETARVLRK